MRRVMLIMILSLFTFLAGCGTSNVSVQNKLDTNRENEMQQAPNQDHVDWNAFHDEGMGY